MLFSFAVLAISNWTKLKIAYVIKVLGEDQMIALGSVISMDEGIYLQKVTALWSDKDHVIEHLSQQSQETVISTFILVYSSLNMTL